MFGKFKMAGKLIKLSGQLDNLRKEADKTMFKSFITSKRNWVQIAGVIATLGDMLPPKYAVIGIAVATAITKIMDAWGQE